MLLLMKGERYMDDRPLRPQYASRPEANSANVTSAIGMEETAGRLRARRHSLFTQTVMWVTGLVCLAFLFGTLTQAWTNNQLMQQLQKEQQKLQQAQTQHDRLVQAASYYNDPYVIESEARQQLGYIRPGEQPVIIVGSSAHNQPKAQASSNTTPPEGYWLMWWRLFSGD
jgi:cell division protein FtsB